MARSVTKNIRHLTCPRCHVTWADVSIGADGTVLPKDIKVLKGEMRVFKDGDDLECTCCSYKYNTADLILMLVKSCSKRNPLEKLAQEAIDGPETEQSI